MPKAATEGRLPGRPQRRETLQQARRSIAILRDGSPPLCPNSMSSEIATPMSTNNRYAARRAGASDPRWYPHAIGKPSSGKCRNQGPAGRSRRAPPIRQRPHARKEHGNHDRELASPRSSQLVVRDCHPPEPDESENQRGRIREYPELLVEQQSNRSDDRVADNLLAAVGRHRRPAAPYSVKKGEPQHHAQRDEREQPADGFSIRSGANAEQDDDRRCRGRVRHRQPGQRTDGEAADNILRHRHAGALRIRSPRQRHHHAERRRNIWIHGDAREEHGCTEKDRGPRDGRCFAGSGVRKRPPPH